MQKPIESEIEGDVDKWQSVRILEQLKRVIVQQTSLASTIFTVVRLICNTLLCESISSSYDYSSALSGNIGYLGVGPSRVVTLYHYTSNAFSVYYVE